LAAVSARAANYDLGLTFGLNRAAITNTIDSDRINGLMAGLYAERKINNHLAICIEVAYAEKGSNSVEYLEPISGSFHDNYDDRVLMIDVTASTRVAYLEFPVLLKLSLKQFAGITPRIYVGPTFAWVTDCKRAEDFWFYDLYESNPDLYSDLFPYHCNFNNTGDKFNINYAVGVSFSYPIAGRTTSLDFRLANGINAFRYYNDGERYRNTVFTVALGVGLYRF